MQRAKGHVQAAFYEHVKPLRRPQGLFDIGTLEILCKDDSWEPSESFLLEIGDQFSRELFCAEWKVLQTGVA